MDSIPTVSRRLPAPLTRAAVDAVPRLPGAVPNGVPARLANTYVAVRPAYLAPATDRSTAPAARTLSEAGWTPVPSAEGTEFRNGSTQVFAAAPESGRTQDALVAAGPSWQARFSSRTPDEVLAHAAAALAEHTKNGPGHADPDAALADLIEAGWSHSRREGTVDFTAPDALAELSWGPDQDTGEPSLRILAGAGGDYWDADLIGAHCPDLLVESVVTYLASPAPARRRLREVPVGLYGHLDVIPEATRTAAAVRAPALRSAACAAAPPTALIRSTTPPPAGGSARRTR
ncbi:DUF317 domain-containing protein [Kitasatospora sp. NPDC057965]|uniref:DUF317 domain-containing protein n=1 Tax=Kitasatospora sp. NPDC057965 TaxID=3346291 RepID=UPI0036DEBDF0